MYHNKPLQIKEGALLIADAHYSKRYPYFLAFLKLLQKGAIKTNQLILMGDIFDLLFGDIYKTIELNGEAYVILKDISENIEVIYLEGNHDFNLKSYFPNVRVYSIEEQPILADFKNKKVLLAHGDTAQSLRYRVYVKVIRNRWILKFLSLINRVVANEIIERLHASHLKKELCDKLNNFEQMALNRIKLYSSIKYDYYLEGHYHQGVSLELGGRSYFNLPSFACKQSFFIVKSSKTELLLRERDLKEFE